MTSAFFEKLNETQTSQALATATGAADLFMAGSEFSASVQDAFANNVPQPDLAALPGQATFAALDMAAASGINAGAAAFDATGLTAGFETVAAAGNSAFEAGAAAFKAQVEEFASQLPEKPEAPFGEDEVVAGIEDGSAAFNDAIGQIPADMFAEQVSQGAGKIAGVFGRIEDAFKPGTEQPDPVEVLLNAIGANSNLSGGVVTVDAAVETPQMALEAGFPLNGLYIHADADVPGLLNGLQSRFEEGQTDPQAAFDGLVADLQEMNPVMTGGDNPLEMYVADGRTAFEAFANDPQAAFDGGSEMLMSMAPTELTSAITTLQTQLQSGMEMITSGFAAV